jgi:hypothetical protein
MRGGARGTVEAPSGFTAPHQLSKQPRRVRRTRTPPLRRSVPIKESPTMTPLSLLRQPALGAVLALTAALAACGGGGGTTSALVAPPVTNPSTTGSVTGSVLDAKTGVPVNGAQIRSGTLSATSGSQGEFTLSNLSPAERVLLQISAANYAEHIQVVKVVANTNTRVSTQLVPTGATASVDIGTGGTVSVPSSPGQATLPGNAVGGSGTVTVNVTPINSSLNPGFLPGDFTSSTGGTPLESFGAVTVGVTNGSGSAVPVTAGQFITIRIPASTRSGALLATLPLFYLDPATGRWREEGTATLGGTAPDQYYEAQVPYAGTWSVNAPYEAVNVTGCVVDQLGARVAGAKVSTDGIDYTGITSADSDASGNFSVPMKKSARAVVTARLAGKTSNSMAVGPSTTDFAADTSCFVLTDQAQSIAIKLTWGENPVDVDAHLLMPSGDHIYFQSPGSLVNAPWANIDVDDRSSFGPEIVTVRKLMVGTYVYAVNNFSGTFTPGLIASPTRVELDVSGVASAYTPPIGEGASTWWEVLSFTVDAQCRVSVTPLNRWSSAPPTAVTTVGAVTYCTAP